MWGGSRTSTGCAWKSEFGFSFPRCTQRCPSCSTSSGSALGLSTKHALVGITVSCSTVNQKHETRKASFLVGKKKNAGFVVGENRSRALNVFNIVLSVCSFFFCGNITGALTLLQVWMWLGLQPFSHKQNENGVEGKSPLAFSSSFFGKLHEEFSTVYFISVLENSSRLPKWWFQKW